jgi:O-antigen/teichoic acid export membrane protein
MEPTEPTEPTEPIKPTSSESLSKKVVRGGIWVFALRFTNRGLGFIRTIILARLLAPEDFGLLGIAMLAIAALETFSQTGFQAALIQKKENVESYLDTAWTVSAVRGILLFLILFFSAPLVAAFFNSPQATLVIKVIAVSTLISGFKNIGILFFQKELEFNKQFIYELSATLVDLTIAITLAFVLRNVWALVWGGLAASFVRLFMSYILHPYRPNARFDKGEFKELFGFGKWVLGSSILIFLVTQGDDIFVGKMLGVTALGFYQMAYLISNLPATEITHVISQVTFPAYSKFQDDLPRLRAAYLDTLQLTAFVSMPIAGGIFILAPEFTQIFLGAKWMPMVPAMQILVLAGVTRSIAATAGTLFISVGRPKIDTVWQIIRLAVLIIFIYPFTAHWNLSGTAIAVLLSICIATIGFCIQAVRIIECTAWSFIKVIALPAMNGLMMVAIVYLAKYRFEHTGIIQFFMLVIIGIISYVVITVLFDRFLNYGMVRLIKEKIDAD